MEFTAHKFVPETDSDRPQLDSQVEYENEKYLVKKVDYILLGDIMSGKAEEPTKEDFDLVLTKRHSFRPAVVWIIWLNKL